VEREIASVVPVTQTAAEHWGQAVIGLLGALDLSDWEALKVEDPVEWVKTLRRENESRLDAYWNGSR
jgi:hypothetical protein